MRKSKLRIDEEFRARVYVASECLCPLCARPIPESQKDKHHLIPKSKKGKATEVMHRVCHRQIHALFSENELAKHYCSAEALLEHPEIQKFVAWIKTKPNEYCPSVKASVARRMALNHK